MIMLEMGLISPPVGVNVFVVRGIALGCTNGNHLLRHLAVPVRHGSLFGNSGYLSGHSPLPTRYDVRLNFTH